MLKRSGPRIKLFKSKPKRKKLFTREINSISPKKNPPFSTMDAEQALKLYLLILWDDFWFSLPGELFKSKHKISFWFWLKELIFQQKKNFLYLPEKKWMF